MTGGLTCRPQNLCDPKQKMTAARGVFAGPRWMKKSQKPSRAPRPEKIDRFNLTALGGARRLKIQFPAGVQTSNQASKPKVPQPIDRQAQVQLLGRCVVVHRARRHWQGTRKKLLITLWKMLVLDWFLLISCIARSWPFPTQSAVFVSRAGVDSLARPPTCFKRVFSVTNLALASDDL